MSILPVPAKTYFSDFAFDLIEFKIQRDGQTVLTAKGLKNKENGKHYVSFFYGTDVQAGDYLISDDETLCVIELLTDTYNGEKQLINAVYRP